MTSWHSRGMATISLLLLMGVTSAMLAALWYAQAQNRTQVDATQIALDRNLARQVVWQRVYNALTLASDVQPPVFEAPAGHADDWWIAGTLDSGTAVAVMSQGTLLVGLPPNLPANHPAHTALLARGVHHRRQPGGLARHAVVCWRRPTPRPLATSVVESPCIRALNPTAALN